MKLTEEQEQVIDLALKTYGAKNQINKTVEELTELSLKLQHYFSGENHLISQDDVSEEIADVFICLHYLFEIFPKEEICFFIESKIKRLAGRIEEHNKSDF